MPWIDEPVFRLTAVGLAAAVAVAWGWWSRRGIALQKHRTRFPGIPPGVVLFTSETCPPCRVVASRLDEAGIRYRRISYQERPETFDELGIRRVPTLAVVGPDGWGWVAVGIPPRWLLKRWFAEPSA